MLKPLNEVTYSRLNVHYFERLERVNPGRVARVPAQNGDPNIRSNVWTMRNEHAF